MNRNTIWQEIELQLREDKKTHPNYPDHVCGQAGRVLVASGEIISAADDLKYSTKVNQQVEAIKIGELRKAAVRTAAAAIRLLENLDK